MAIINKADYYTAAKKVNEIYSDLMTNFDMHPGKKDLARLVNEDAVKRSIKNLLYTNYFERPYQPTVGSSLRSLLFEPVDASTEMMLKEAIKNTIENHEPRCRLDDVVVTGLPDNNSYVVTVVFTLINKQDPVSVDIILNRLG